MGDYVEMEGYFMKEMMLKVSIVLVYSPDIKYNCINEGYKPFSMFTFLRNR